MARRIHAATAILLHGSCGSIVGEALHRYRHVIDNLSKDLFGLLRLLFRRRISSADDDAMGEDGDGERLEVFGSGEVASIDVSHGLGGAVEHERSAGRDAER